MAGLKLSALRFAGVAKETSYGVPATTGIRWLPVQSPNTELQTKYEMDKAIRGIAAQTFGAYQGVQNGKFSYTLPWYITDTPIILTSILGPDTKTGTVAPYTHTFNLAAAEPASLTVHDYDAIDQYQYAGSMLSQASFKLDSEGNLSCDIQGLGFPPVSEATATPTYASEAYFLGWEGALSLGGSSNARLVSMQIDFKRTLTPRWTANNSQVPQSIWAGPLQVSGKATFDVFDDTEYTHYTSNDQPSFVMTLTQPSSTNAVKFQLSKCAFTEAQKISSKDWIQVDGTIEGIYNATDAGPGLVAVTNGQATTY